MPEKTSTKKTLLKARTYMKRRFIGIDLHKKSFTVAIKNEDGIISIFTMELLPDSIEKLKSMLKKTDYVAVEASGSTFYFYDQIKECVEKCVIVNPKRFKVVYESSNKNDKKDAKILAKYLSYEDLLPEVYVPDENIRKLRSYFSLYNLTKKQINQTRNRICSLLLFNGINLEPAFLFDKSNSNAIYNLDIDKDYIEILKRLYEKLEDLEKEKEFFTYKMFAFGKEKYENEINILTSISGISILIALALISDIADIKRFNNSKKLCSYLGVVPKVDSSGGTTKIGSLQRESRKNSRTLLTQVIRHLCNNSDHLKDFFLRKKKKGYCKAKVAIMRKIITIIYHMLSKNEYCYYYDEKKQERKLKSWELFLKKGEEKFNINKKKA
jgi:transposase